MSIELRPWLEVNRCVWLLLLGIAGFLASWRRTLFLLLLLQLLLLMLKGEGILALDADVEEVLGAEEARDLGLPLLAEEVADECLEVGLPAQEGDPVQGALAVRTDLVEQEPALLRNLSKGTVKERSMRDWSDAHITFIKMLHE